MVSFHTSCRFYVLVAAILAVSILHKVVPLSHDARVCVCVCVCVYVCRGGGGGAGRGGRGVGGTHYISMGRDLLKKRGLIFRVSGTVVCFIVKNLGRDSNIPVWKGVHVCLERGWETTLAYR